MDTNINEDSPLINSEPVGFWHPRSRPYRYTILLLVSLICFGSYFTYDEVSPIQDSMNPVILLFCIFFFFFFFLHSSHPSFFAQFILFSFVFFSFSLSLSHDNRTLDWTKTIEDSSIS